MALKLRDDICYWREGDVNWHFFVREGQSLRKIPISARNYNFVSEARAIELFIAEKHRTEFVEDDNG